MACDGGGSDGDKDTDGGGGAVDGGGDAPVGPGGAATPCGHTPTAWQAAARGVRHPQTLPRGVEQQAQGKKERTKKKKTNGRRKRPAAAAVPCLSTGMGAVAACLSLPSTNEWGAKIERGG